MSDTQQLRFFAGGNREEQDGANMRWWWFRARRSLNRGGVHRTTKVRLNEPRVGVCGIDALSPISARVRHSSAAVSPAQS